MIAQRTPHRALADRLRASESVLTWAAAQASGNRHALRACIADGSVVRVLPEIYAAREHASTPKVRLAAASTWSATRGALSGVAAAHVWGVCEAIPDRITVAMPPNLHRAHPDWIRVARATTPHSVYVVAGLRVLEPHYAMVNGWNELPVRERHGFVIASVQRGVTTASAIAQAAETTPRVAARKELEELLGLLDQGVTSYLEYVAKLNVFTGRRCPWLQWQVSLVAGGRRRVVDIFDSEARIAIELDGRAFHNSDAARRPDIERDTALSSLGIQVLRFTYEDIVYRPQWCLHMYLAARGQRLGARSANR